MPIRFLKTTAAALVLSVAPAFAQSDMDASTVVATVNGVDITLGNMLMVRASLPPEYGNASPAQLWEGIMTQLVQQEALAQDERANEQNRKVRIALQNERRILMASNVIEQHAAAMVDEAAVQKAYDEQYTNTDQGVEYNASHILVETQEEAQEIVDVLRKGAVFAAVARDRSTGPSAANGGNLGWFGPGMMVPAFQTVVEQLDVGEVSPPVQTQFGWHVITLNETRVTSAPEFESVRQQIEEELQRTAIQTLIDERIGNSIITRMSVSEVDPSVINNIELLED